MAEMEKVEFEFPHEAEEKESKAGSKVVKVEEEKPEIEVVDDTPPEDRGRKPMEEPPKEMTDDELAKYDEGVRKRIQHFTKGYHEERRAKEEALRIREEAVAFAKQLAEENKKLQGSLNQGQTALIEQAKKNAATEYEQAKKKYKDAYESGDSEALVSAQEELMKAQGKLERISNLKPRTVAPEVKVPESFNTPAEPQRPVVDERANQWQSNNTWFGKDRRMTSYALALHEELTQEERINPSSDEYYKRIDAEMRRRFPDKFESGGNDGQQTNAEPSSKPSNVVAPVTRGTAAKKVVLTKSQVELAKRLGVPLELYARKVAEQNRK
jgi:hypothetical protein